MYDLIHKKYGGVGSAGYYELCRTLQTFECKLDLDVQHFLNNKAIESNERGIAYTHLIFDEEICEAGEQRIEGYFTLTMKTLEFGDGVSNSTIKKLCGGYKKHSKPFILVAQLGKYIGDTRVSELTLQDILSCILDQVRSIDRFVPVRYILVECSKEMLSTGLYQSLGFTLIGHTIRESKPCTEELYQLVYEVPNKS